MLQDRLLKVREILKENDLDAILVSDVSNIFYLTNFSAFDPRERSGYLLITKQKNFVITNALYTEAAEMNIRNFKVIEKAKNWEDLIKNYPSIKNLKNVGYDENNLTVSEFLIFKKLFRLKKSSGLIEKIREIKDVEEINNIKKACKISDNAFYHILSKLKEGITEEEIVYLFLDYFKKNNSSHSFIPIIAFAKNSSSPHHQSGKNKLKKNQIVLMDFGVKYNNYSSDVTRTVFFGKADDKFKKMYKTVLEAQNKAFDAVNTRQTLDFKKIDEFARKYIISQKYPNIPHSLGHGIGIDVHESPRVGPRTTGKLRNRTIFSLEPGIYLKGYGGIRIEDLVLFDKGSLSFLTHSKRELIEI